MSESKFSDLDEKFVKGVEDKVRYQIHRLRNSGAVDDTTPLCVLYAVALDNVRIAYDDLRSNTAKKLMRI